MKAIMIMFDSLNRHMLPPYGGDFVHAPNFQRLAERSVTFDQSWVGSMPCMPARRDLHTGRQHFLHRSWGPLEPFDDSMPELLDRHGVHTHLVSDHYHYWEDGGATYHTRYSTWEFCRGQEGDPWKGQVADPVIPEHVGEYTGHRGKLFRQDWINRSHMDLEERHPQARTFEQGMAFIRTNHREDRWFLHIEAFDPHEPFFTPERFKALYPHEYDGPHFDWPQYEPVHHTREVVEHARYEYAALVSMCDEYLGKVMDLMDELGLWEDTMLIVNTDHGFLLGEHDWWAKNRMPFYNEIARTPLFMWDPRTGERGVRSAELVQMMDMAPTLLDYFGVRVPQDMVGRPIEVRKAERSERKSLIFGMHGGHVNCTDGRFVYMRAPVREDNEPLNNYTLMPTHMADRFRPEELRDIRLVEPFAFTKGIQTMKLRANTSSSEAHGFGKLLFDLAKDPGQEASMEDQAVEALMIEELVHWMKMFDAPVEQFERLGLPEAGRSAGDE